MSWFKKAEKSLKKTLHKWGEEIGDVAKPVGQVGIKAVKYGGAFGVALIPGIGLPLAVAIGAGSQGLAATHRAKNKKKAFVRSAVIGAATVVGVRGVSSILGSSVGGGVAKSGTSGLAEAGLDFTSNTTSVNPLDSAFLTGFKNASSSELGDAMLFKASSGGSSVLGEIGGGSGTSGLAEASWSGGSASGGTSILGEVASIGLKIGGSVLGGATPQSALGIAAQDAVQGNTGLDISGLLPTGYTASPSEEVPESGVSPVFLIGGAVVLLWALMRKRKAA